MPERTSTFFVDRSLGRIAVPQALRAAGWAIVVHDDHYRPRSAIVADVEWLRDAGSNGWSILMKDERIRYRAAERQALIDAGVRVFCLSSGNLRGSEMGRLFLEHQAAIWSVAEGRGPSFHAITRAGIRAINLEGDDR